MCSHRGSANTVRVLSHALQQHLTLAPGEIVYVEALGFSLVILNSAQAIRDLFEKRGEMYSHRPRLSIAQKLIATDKVCTISDVVQMSMPDD